MADRPNILLVTADHMNWDTICGRSICRTPHINRLAEEGVSFERSYTPVSICCPTRAMLVSGAYPWHNGVYNQVHVPEAVSRDMHEDVATYSQHLREAGYRLGYVGKWHASFERGPLDFGYHSLRAPRCLGADCLARYDLPEEQLYRDHAARPRRTVGERYLTWPGGDRFLMWAGVDAEPDATPQHSVAQAGADALHELADRDEPWLAEVHFSAPHDPYEPLLRFLEHYRLENVSLPESFYGETFANKPRMLRIEADTWSELSEEEFRQARRHYLAYCEQVDLFVGRVLDTLAEIGAVQNTLTIFTCDHGDHVGAHRCFSKGWQPYEETHRIPMVARWPGVIPAGSRTEALVQLHDWAHTIVEVADAEPLPHADGRSLVELLQRPEIGQRWRDHIMNVYYGEEFLYTQRIAIGRRHKYVFNGFDIDELYDLERDPAELHNVIDHPAYQDTAQAMRDALWDMMFTYEDPYSEHRYGAARYLQGPTGGLPR
ncbi:MAG: sulfatase-like hydrolase/transferase [Armatimonadota bacterium]